MSRKRRGRTSGALWSSSGGDFSLAPRAWFLVDVFCQVTDIPTHPIPGSWRGLRASHRRARRWSVDSVMFVSTACVPFGRGVRCLCRLPATSGCDVAHVLAFSIGSSSVSRRTAVSLLPLVFGLALVRLYCICSLIESSYLFYAVPHFVYFGTSVCLSVFRFFDGSPRPCAFDANR